MRATLGEADQKRRMIEQMETKTQRWSAGRWLQREVEGRAVLRTSVGKGALWDARESEVARQSQQSAGVRKQTGAVATELGKHGATTVKCKMMMGESGRGGERGDGGTRARSEMMMAIA